MSLVMKTKLCFNVRCMQNVLLAVTVTTSIYGEQALSRFGHEFLTWLMSHSAERMDTASDNKRSVQTTMVEFPRLSSGA